MLVPSKDANGAPANSGRVEERISPPGAATSGFIRWPNGVGPADENAVIVPPRPGCSSCFANENRTAALPPTPRRKSRSRAPSRSEIVPAGMSSAIVSASPERLSTSTIPTAPPYSARISFETSAHPPRKTSAIVPLSDERGRVVSSAFGCWTPQSCGSTGRPSVPVTEPTSTTVWSRVCQPLNAAAGNTVLNGTSCSVEGARESWTVIDGPKTWTFDEAATVIASGAEPGESMLPRPKSSRELPAAMTGTTPAATTFCSVSTIASFAGSVCVPPPEKLMTSMPSRTADSNAATISGVFAVNPARVGTLKTR